MLVALAGALALAAHAGTAGAQEPAPQSRTCRQVLPSDFRRLINIRGEEMVYFRDPVRVLCTGGILLEADSAVMNRAGGTVELVGDVVYRDSTRELQADWANYLGRNEQLLTRGDTRLQDLSSGAVVSGDDLNYLRETESRPVARLTVTGGRPHAVIPPGEASPLGAVEGEEGTESAEARAEEETAAPAPAPADSGVATEVWADRMEFLGSDIFEGYGNVELERGGVTGAGETARFDQTEERMVLTGDAFVENVDFRLEGDRIDARLRGEGIEQVLTEGTSRLVSQDLDVRSERIRIALTEGDLERLEAWNPDPAAAEWRARALARDFRLRADSIDVQADSLGVREMRAVGRAYGERGPVTAASMDQPSGAAAPDTAAAVANDSVAADSVVVLDPVLERDWIQGDTILGYFQRQVVRPPPPVVTRPLTPEEEAALESQEEVETVLERIVVVGGSGRALSLYRMQREEGAEESSINFMKASRIILYMEEGDVARVEAEGPIEGVYLDPAGVAEGGEAEQGEAGGPGRGGPR